LFFSFFNPLIIIFYFCFSKTRVRKIFSIWMWI
jgi:hypothetical protein